MEILNKISDIVTAWGISFNPTERQTEIAEKRYEICKSCEHMRKIVKDKKWSFICDKCGCLISRKIYINKVNFCNLGKWDEIDKEYFKQKNKTSLI